MWVLVTAVQSTMVLENIPKYSTNDTVIFKTKFLNSFIFLIVF